MMVFIKIKCNGVKLKVLELIYGEKGIKWRRLNMEQVVNNIKRKLKKKGGK